MDKLSSVVASASDLVFGSRIPVNDPEVTELDYQGHRMGPAEVTLVAAATSTMAALTSTAIVRLSYMGRRWQGERLDEAKFA